MVALAEDWRSCSWLSEKELAMLEFTEKLTLTPYTMAREDVEKLRAAGLDDEEVVEATLICCRYNYMCRLVDALGAVLPETVRNSALDKELTSRGVAVNAR